MNGDFFGGGTAATLDVLQGDPSRVRDLAVGVGSIRTIRAEASATGPNVTGDLRLADGHIKGTVTNHSDRTLEAAALVVGSSAVRLRDIAAGSSVDVDLPVNADSFNGIQLSERIFGPQNWDGSPMDETEQRTMVRRSVIDQLSVDPMTGFPNAIPTDTATLMAWGTEPVVPIEIEGQRVRRVANILYDVPLPYSVGGNATFAGDLLRSSVLEIGANFFSQGPVVLQHGPGDRPRLVPPDPVRRDADPDEDHRRPHARGRRFDARRERPRAQGDDPLRAGHRRLRRPGRRAAGHRGARRQDRRLGPVRRTCSRERRTS